MKAKAKTEAKPKARKPAAKAAKKDQPAAPAPVAVAKSSKRAASGTAFSTLRIKLVRSPIGYPERQRLVVAGLGLRRMHQVVERKDTPEIRGMVSKIPHLVEIVA